MSIKAGAGVLVLAIALVSAGCGALRQPFGRNSKGPDAAKGQPGTQLPSDIQNQVMRFADEYATRVAEATDDLRRRVPTPETRIEALKWKLSQATAAYISASGTNPVLATLDMVTLATLSRMVVEDHWVGQLFGDSAKPLLEVHRQLEDEAWSVARGELKPEQEQQVRDVIAAWRATHPEQVLISQTRLLDFVTSGSQGTGQAGRPSSLLGLLRVDPLAGLEPATRQIEEARLLAERTTYYLQRMPTLISWHAELVAYELAGAPESQQVLADSERLTTAMEAYATVAKQLPQLLSGEREAAIDQVFDRLEGSEKTLRASLIHVKESAQAGTELAKSTDAAIQSLDRFVARFDKGKEAATTSPAGRPFDILDYATTAKEVAATIERLNVTLNSLDRAMPQIQAAAATLEATGDRLLVRLLLVGAALVVLLLVGALSVALLYRRLGSPSARVA